MSLIEWMLAGRPAPPPDLVKQAIVKEYAYKYSLNILIETGTFLGNMVAATKDTFRQIYSIELQPQLYEQAKQRFSQLNHIKIVHGDSSEVLQQILPSISEACLFWLDAHYSCAAIPTARGPKETPILEELNLILNHPYHHVILIDDIRLFVGSNDYPLLYNLQQFIYTCSPEANLTVEDDIMRVLL
jgi:hypothetical protein